MSKKKGLEVEMNRYLLMLKLIILGNGYKRANYLKKIGYFHSQGENCYFQPFNFGTEPRLISFGSNVWIAANVHFYTHDVVSHMLEKVFPGERFTERVGSVRIGDNVFVGGGSEILYGSSIGNNVIIAAGSLVSGEIPSDTVCAGRPAKPVGRFDDYADRMRSWSASVPWDDSDHSKHSHMERVFFSDNPPTFPSDKGFGE